MKIILCVAIVLLMATSTLSRTFLLNLEMDQRKLVHMSTFRLYKTGYLDVNLMGFQILPIEGQQELMAFTLDRTLSEGINPYETGRIGTCGIQDDKLGYEDERISSIVFRLDFLNKLVHVSCSRPLQTNIKIFRNSSLIPVAPSYFKKGMFLDRRAVIQQRRRRSVYGLANNKKVHPNGRETVEDYGSIKNKQSIISSVSSHPSEQLSPIQQYVPNVFAQNPSSSASAASVQKYDDKLNKYPVSDEEWDNDDEKYPNLLFQDPSTAAPLAETCNGISLPLIATPLSDGSFSYSTTFTVYIAGEDCEGLYSLFFHNCDHKHNSVVNINMSAIEKNLSKNSKKKYLPSGEMALPARYCIIPILFFISGCVLVFILKKNNCKTITGNRQYQLFQHNWLQFSNPGQDKSISPISFINREKMGLNPLTEPMLESKYSCLHI